MKMLLEATDGDTRNEARQWLFHQNCGGITWSAVGLGIPQSWLWNLGPESTKGDGHSSGGPAQLLKLRKDTHKFKVSLGNFVRLCLKIPCNRVGGVAQW